jgi:hypothetical protein
LVYTWRVSEEKGKRRVKEEEGIWECIKRMRVILSKRDIV